MNTQPNHIGQQPTKQTPLTVSAHLGLGGANTKTQRTIFDGTLEDEGWIYHSTFNVKTSDPIEVELFQHNTRYKIFEGKFIPWTTSLHDSTHIKYDYEYMFYPIKLSGAPCTFTMQEAVYRQDGHDIITASNMFSKDSPTTTFVLEDGKPYVHRINLPWLNFPLFLKRNDYPFSRKPSAYVSVSLRNPYVPTSLHPDNFYVLVFIRFVNVENFGVSITPDQLTTYM